MNSKDCQDTAKSIERLTDVRVALDDKAIRGRNIWGRVAFRRSGMLHVEIMPGDKQVNDAVMPSISAEDMQLGGDDRYRAYRNRCKEAAEQMNARAISENGLVLFVSSNGHLTRTAKALIEALL